MSSTPLRVLFLGSEPAGAPPVKIDAELIGIRNRFQANKTEDQVLLVPELDPQFINFPDQIDKYRPHIIHFSGHGNQKQMLVFESAAGTPFRVPPEAVRDLLNVPSVRKHVRGVVLHACWTLPLAKDLAKSVDFVIGNAEPILNPAAAAYSQTFYGQLAKGKPLREAFDMARPMFRAEQPGVVPEMVMHAGIDLEGYDLRAGAAERPHVVVAAAHDDPKDQKLWEELQELLAPLERKGAITVWSIDRIVAGDKRDAAMTRNIERADLIILLVSTPALNDDLWLRVHQRALERQAARSATVLPIYARPAAIDDTFFAGTKMLLHRGKALSAADDRDEAWLTVWKNVAEHIKAIKEDLDRTRAEEKAICDGIRQSQAQAPAASPAVEQAPVRKSL